MGRPNRFIEEIQSSYPKHWQMFLDFGHAWFKENVGMKIPLSRKILEKKFCDLPFEIISGVFIKFLDQKKIFIEVKLLNSINDSFYWGITDKTNNDIHVHPSDGLQYSSRGDAMREGIVQAFKILEKKIKMI